MRSTTLRCTGLVHALHKLLSDLKSKALSPTETPIGHELISMLISCRRTSYCQEGRAPSGRCTPTARAQRAGGVARKEEVHSAIHAKVGAGQSQGRSGRHRPTQGRASRQGSKPEICPPNDSQGPDGRRRGRGNQQRASQPPEPAGASLDRGTPIHAHGRRRRRRKETPGRYLRRRVGRS